MTIARPVQERFWEKVSKQPGQNSCWLWTGSIFKQGVGYGQFQGTTAHRWAWFLAHGKIPKGLVIRHKCDIPLCVRPSHLIPGTYGDNSSDMVARGRSARGVKQHSAKLTESDVCLIRSLLAQGHTQRYIASLFGVSQTRISYIKLGKDWGWLSCAG